MDNINWTNMISNEDVLARVEESRRLVETIRSRKTRWVGHLLRYKRLVKEIIKGRMEEKLPRERKGVMMLDDI